MDIQPLINTLEEQKFKQVDCFYKKLYIKGDYMVDLEETKHEGIIRFRKKNSDMLYESWAVRTWCGEPVNFDKEITTLEEIKKKGLTTNN